MPTITITTAHKHIPRLDFIEYDIEGHNEAEETVVSSTINEVNRVVSKEDLKHVNAIDYEDTTDCANDRITVRAMHTEEDIVPPMCARKIGHHGTCLLVLYNIYIFCMVTNTRRLFTCFQR